MITGIIKNISKQNVTFFFKIPPKITFKDGEATFTLHHYIYIIFALKNIFQLGRK